MFSKNFACVKRTTNMRYERDLPGICDICHFGTPPVKGLKQVHQKRVNSRQNSQNWSKWVLSRPKFLVLFAEKYISSKKVHHRQFCVVSNISYATWSQTPSAASIESNLSNSFSWLWIYKTTYHITRLGFLDRKYSTSSSSGCCCCRRKYGILTKHLRGHLRHHVVDVLLHQEAGPLNQGDQKLSAIDISA